MKHGFIFSFWAYFCRDICFLMLKNNFFSHGNQVAIFPRQQHVPILHCDRSKLKYDWFDYINFAADNTSSWDVLSLQLISAWLASWPGSEQFSTLLPLLAFLQSHAFCKLTRAFQECQAILKVLATYRCHDINIRHAELHTQYMYTWIRYGLAGLGWSHDLFVNPWEAHQNWSFHILSAHPVVWVGSVFIWVHLPNCLLERWKMLTPIYSDVLSVVKGMPNMYIYILYISGQIIIFHQISVK